MVLDLSGVELHQQRRTCGSCCLSPRNMQNSGANFAICSLQGQVRELFTVSGFDQIIQISDSQEAALASFN